MQKLFHIYKKDKASTKLLLILVVLIFIAVVIIFGISVYNFYKQESQVEEIKSEAPVPRSEDKKEGELQASPDAEDWN